MTDPILANLIQTYSNENLEKFFQWKSRDFAPRKESIAHIIEEGFADIQKLGEIQFANKDQLLVCSIKVTKDLTERSGKKAQFELAKKILKYYQDNFDGIFVFHDANGNFRFSLIYANYYGTRKSFSNYRRFTYYVCSKLTNKTFIQRMGDGDFSSLDKIKEIFSVEKVTKEFYEQLAYWYFWALKECQFPEAAEKEENGRETSVIRMITRMIFIWFMREKGLIQNELFNKQIVSKWLIDVDSKSSSYYLAILQNLFFATLNTRIEDRKFRSETRGLSGHNPDFGNQYVYRYQSMFSHPEKLQDYFQEIPFLNGGLFDCLDNKDTGEYYDGFTDIIKNQPSVPNRIFFSSEINVDLNADMGTTGRRYTVKGLIDILSSFNFTIDENTPDDKDVALDPELLGRVFENLLASFNPETATTARRATGSYYTPREIVGYMVDESLKAYLQDNLSDIPDRDLKIDWLFSQDMENNPFSSYEMKRIVDLIEKVRIVDPAVGSGAYPMGILNKLVYMLSKVDPNNHLWQQAQLDVAQNIPDPILRTEQQKNIRKYFEDKNPDYGRKLFLIQKCIYGVDIQQIAVEIAKLRFFISLLVDETVDKEKDNWGIEPLPNLEFKIMQGNSLKSSFESINFDPGSAIQPAEDLFAAQDEKYKLIKRFQDKKELYQSEANHWKKVQLQDEIDQILIELFKHVALSQKKDYANAMINIQRKYATIQDPERRAELTNSEQKKFAKQTGFDSEKIESRIRQYSKKHMIRDFFPWGLYFSEVFAEKGGFDIVLSNPPYIRQEKIDYKSELEDLFPEIYSGRADLYVYFFIISYKLLKHHGSLLFIVSDKFLIRGYSRKLRGFLSKKMQINQLIDFGENPVFTATVESFIFIGKKNPAGLVNNEIRYDEIADIRELSEKSSNSKPHSILINQENLSESEWILTDNSNRELMNYLQSSGRELTKVVNNQIFSGIKTGRNDVFIIDKDLRDYLVEKDPRSDEIIKKWLVSDDLIKWGINWEEKYIIFTYNGIKINQYPSVLDYLNSHKDSLLSRATVGKHAWYELQQPQTGLIKYFNTPKILYQNVSRYYKFAMDVDGYHPDMNVLFIPVNDLFLLGVLASSTMRFFAQTLTGAKTGGFLVLRTTYVSRFPIPEASISLREKISNIVYSLTQKAKHNANTTESEKTLNDYVYELYKLSNRQIDTIECSLNNQEM